MNQAEADGARTVKWNEVRAGSHTKGNLRRNYFKENKSMSTKFHKSYRIPT
jgi:hypothetical protein